MMTKEREDKIRKSHIEVDGTIFEDQRIVDLLAEIDRLRGELKKDIPLFREAEAHLKELLKERDSLKAENENLRRMYLNVHKENQCLKDRIGKLREAIRNERDELSRNLTQALAEDDKH